MKGGGSVPGVTADSVKNKEKNGSFYSIKSGVSVCRGVDSEYASPAKVIWTSVHYLGAGKVMGK